MTPTDERRAPDYEPPQAEELDAASIDVETASIINTGSNPP